MSKKQPLFGKSARFRILRTGDAYEIKGRIRDWKSQTERIDEDGIQANRVLQADRFYAGTEYAGMHDLRRDMRVGNGGGTAGAGFKQGL